MRLHLEVADVLRYLERSVQKISRRDNETATEREGREGKEKRGWSQENWSRVAAAGWRDITYHSLIGLHQV